MFSLISVLFNNLLGHPNCAVGLCFSVLNWKTLASVLLPFLLLLCPPLPFLFIFSVSKFLPPIEPLMTFLSTTIPVLPLI